MKHWIYKLFAFTLLLSISGLSLWWFYLYPKQNLFQKGKIAENFRSMERIFPSKVIAKSTTPYTIPEKLQELNVRYNFQGKEYVMSDVLEESATTGFIIIKNDEITYEKYFQGNNSSARNTSWSLAKSFTSALVGIAIAEGKIANVNDPVTKYVPELVNTAYNNVPIKHILQMSSGVRFGEDYSSSKSDINQLLPKLFRDLRALDQVIADFPVERKSGEKFYYISLDAHVLGLLIRRSTGQSFTEYFQTKLWQPLGAESDASWLTDLYGSEVTFCCLNATLRDYAKFGLLYLHNGKLNGIQVLSQSWVKESITPDCPYLQAGATDSKYAGFGYQYQWWIPPNSNGDFLAKGLRGQYIYINPRQNVVIVKTSAADKPSTGDQHLLMVSLFRAIANTM